MSTFVALTLACMTSNPLGLLQEPQAGWDDAVDPVESSVESDTPPAQPARPDPVTTPTLDAPPPQAVVQRPDVSKATGLIVAASVTGGLAWVVGLTRMAIISRCARQIEEGELGDGSFGCIFRAGTASLVLFPTQWTLNYATWGLAPAAGAIRGRHDGVAYAFDGVPERSAGAFIGSGAALLGVGVIGRIAMYPMFGRALRGCVDDGSKCLTHLRLQAFGVQLSAAMIGAGAGLLAYGIAYNSSSKKYGRLLDQHAIRVAPQIGFDYTGLGLSGQF
jgi:hypothetical protein